MRNEFRAPQSRAPEIEAARTGNPGGVKADDLLNFGYSKYTVTTQLLADAQSIDNLLVAFRIASLQIL